MTLLDQREQAKQAVRQQQNRCDFINYLYDRSGRHDLPKGQHPHAVFTGLAEDFALELGREIVQDMSSNWHIKNVRDGLEVRDNAKKIVFEQKDEAQN
tara:strand:- start:540 stop:833 length:294 start_codon:yes stop_codon:yes gene_type:complete